MRRPLFDARCEPQHYKQGLEETGGADDVKRRQVSDHCQADHPPSVPHERHQTVFL